MTLTALNTQATRQATSNEQGTFQFTGLLPGEYKLDVRSTNFANLTQTVRLEVGQQMTLTIKLEVGSLNTTVTSELIRRRSCALPMRASEKSSSAGPFRTCRSMVAC